MNLFLVRFFVPILGMCYSLLAMDASLERQMPQRQRPKQDKKEEIDFLADTAKKLYIRLNCPPTLWELCLNKLFIHALRTQNYEAFENPKLGMRERIEAWYKHKHAVDFFTVFSGLCKPTPTSISTPFFCMVCALDRYFIVQRVNKIAIYRLDAEFSPVFETEGEFCGITDDSTHILIATSQSSFLLELCTLNQITIKGSFQPQDDVLLLHDDLTYTIAKNLFKYLREPTINGVHPYAKELEEFSDFRIGPEDYIFGQMFFSGRSYIATKNKYDFNAPWFRAKELKNRDLSAIPLQFLTGSNSLIMKTLRNYIEAKGFTPYCSALTRDARYAVLAGVDTEAADGNITRDGRLFNNLIIRVDVGKNRYTTRV